MKNTIDKIEAAFLDAGRLRKSIGIAEEARAIADSFRAIDSRTRGDRKAVIRRIGRPLWLWRRR